jgi:AGZA family xanthine/uracil permease-like MFS transporter
VALGDVKQPMTLLALGGLALIAVLEVLKVRGGILIGIVVTTLAGWGAGLVHWNPQTYSVAEMTSTAFQLDLKGALGLGGHGIGLALVEILFVFVFVDLFDNVGTLVAVTTKAGLVAPDGTIPRLNRILVADAAATTVGALAGTSTVVSYIESASGVSAGGRTGLTAVVVGLLFLVALFAAPLAQAIPAAATAPALILVGAMMMAPLADIDWADPSVAIPAFLTLVAIPLTFSIANGLAFGVIAYVGIRALTGRLKRGDWLLAVLAVLFVARFAYMAAA